MTAIGLCVAWSSNLMAAQITLGTADWGEPAIFIDGVIESGDLQKVEALSRRMVQGAARSSSISIRRAGT